MTTVFGHGRLRLYLLKLLDGGPRHGYELIRLLEDKFLGLYAPSAGTIYPRLQRLEAEGLVTHHAVGGRKIYRITEAGRAELRQRADEVATLESEIHASVSDLAKLAGDIRTEVRGSVRDLKQELRAAARETRRGDRESRPSGAYPRSAGGNGGPGGEWPAAGRSGGGRPRTGDPGEGADPVAEFDRHLLLFVAEVRALAESRRFSEAQLRTAARLLNGALDGLRRLLR
ncbi:PadR family transcriptional regulator [Plantactinospora solaniradicis]|uniref:PadR family transcriptional regulator n=1 Tax=Plantactinospora solaniradicis TaxID=1723736 RepID=A0ABW1K012_9ACTN